ncbi:MAG: DUF6282 family protein [Lachnospiraceae bacterium]|nr:DUF6282 family protein [Lachnospiraceae bacterium]
MYNPKHAEEVFALMKGAYDLHTHTSPDFVKRSLNDDELLKQADQYGMAGVMLKNHLDPTPARAIIINTSGRYSAKAYSSAVLNLSIGGLNPIAVKYYLQMGAKVIWMPTLHARNQIEYFGRDKNLAHPGIRLLDEEGMLKPEVLVCLDYIKEYDATVATGHISIGESIAVCTAAREKGIRTVLTHPDWTCTTLPVDVQKSLVSQGVMVEKLWFDIGINHVTSEYMAKTIQDLGAENCYMATDRGQAGVEYPAEGMMMFMDAMLDCGLTYDEIYKMTHDNPKKVLGMTE